MLYLGTLRAASAQNESKPAPTGRSAAAVALPPTAEKDSCGAPRGDRFKPPLVRCKTILSGVARAIEIRTQYRTGGPAMSKRGRPCGIELGNSLLTYVRIKLISKLWKNLIISLVRVAAAIDISKATLDFAVVVANKLLFHYQSTNNKTGIEDFIKQLKTQCPNANFKNSLYCMEHTARAAPWHL